MANCKIKKSDPMKNEIKHTPTDFEVVYPNQKEIDATNDWLNHKQEYLKCLSERHPHYEFTKSEIKELKNRIINLKKA